MARQKRKAQSPATKPATKAPATTSRDELVESALDKVAGGTTTSKAQVSDLTIMKVLDKTSP
jgi:hypothetical protein